MHWLRSTIVLLTALCVAVIPAVAEPPESKPHWAFAPITNPPAPRVRNPKWVTTSIDPFILARLEARGLAPAPRADRRTLIRRACFDLLGLPPTYEEVEAFVADRHPQAYEKLIDRLLRSPHYGERWGRYWLDVARYADTKGYLVGGAERRFPYSYTYRDWVIDALNEDLPYDQFLRYQIAADHLTTDADRRHLAALGFLTLGRRFINNIHEIIDDRIDVVCRGTMALTVQCARCHDHKYDPIPTRDYYSLYGVFASSVEPNDLPLLAEPAMTPEHASFLRELKVRTDAVEKFRRERAADLAGGNRVARDQLVALQRNVEQWQINSPVAPPRAMALVDTPTPTTPYVFLRGNPQNRGPEVPRQFLALLAGPERKPFEQGSGRRELAESIVQRDNPLTSRVLVNRVWMHHFGRPLVRTPGDFGLRSEPPTHPELLDHLAWQFTGELGWSLKKLHRLIMTSSVYRQMSEVTPTSAARGRPHARASADPEGLLYAHFPRRRLDFEAMRDALLSVAGQLDLTRGGRSVELTGAEPSRRRAVYGYIDRQNLPSLFRTFDFASPDISSPQRFETTVPQQALFMMNSPFAIERARALVAGLAPFDGASRVQALYRRIYARDPSADESTLALKFVAGAADPMRAWEQFAQVLLLSNEFVFVD